MNRIQSLIIILVAAGLALGFFVTKQWTSQKNEPNRQTIVQRILPTQNQQEIEEKIPAAAVSLSIPTLGVQASVESVGLDHEGKMDVPKNVYNVAWYTLGYKPGEKGNAVIAGHLDTQTGAPAVFYSLSNLEPGDKVQVIDANNTTYTFIVTRKAVYTLDEFPLQEVFGESSQKNLNLITCDGSFNQATKSYSHRTVVYTTLKE